MGRNNKNKGVNLGRGGCLCWDEERYSPECCDPDDRYAEHMGRSGFDTEPDTDKPES